MLRKRGQRLILLHIFENIDAGGKLTFSFLTDINGAKQDISDMHVDGEEDGLKNGHDQELQGIQFPDYNPE